VLFRSRLFDIKQAKDKGHSVDRQYEDDFQEYFDLFQRDLFKNGLLYKRVNVDTYLSTEDVKPRPEELESLMTPMKVARKKKHGSVHVGSDESSESSDEESSNEKESKSKLTNIMRIFGEHIEEDDDVPLIIGDYVQVVSGELQKVIGVVVSVQNLVLGIVRIKPKSSGLTQEMDIEVNKLIKHIDPGYHVEVAAGKFLGQTGRVVSVNPGDSGRIIATILRDGTNKEMRVNVNHLRKSDKVSIGTLEIGGYSLYDLAILNDNETAVVINVDSERLTVINHLDIVKHVMPQELQGKRMARNEIAMDQHNNPLKQGNMVNVTSGAHASKAGTIKHIYKGNVWLHSNVHLKNSGVFVIKGKACVLAGAVSGTSGTQEVPQRVSAGGLRTRGKDTDNINKTIKIIQGAHKGLLGNVIACDATYYQVELLSKMKRVTIERTKTKLVGDKDGSFAAPHHSSALGVVPSTPYLTQDTPTHFGNETPRYTMGSETPLHGYGGETPRGSYVDDIWKVGAQDTAEVEVDPGSMINSVASSREGHHWNQGGDSVETWPVPSVGDASPFSQVSSPAMGTPSSQYTNTYSPSGSSMYSPSAATPISESGMSTSSGRKQSASRNWVEQLIVVFKRGNFTGREGVIIDPPSNGDRLSVRLRDGSTAVHDCSIDEVALADPPKKGKVVILSGKSKGRFGTFRDFAGRDFVVEFTGETSKNLFSKDSVGWVSVDR